ncbi:PilW family protein [Psychromonas aquimarina]|uniref:PilW family protein n=1 Tax=Psychromonas aquimarina TaxID=444919 RepID=UPI00048D3F45|nr:PilW family protein [Psychromonas aquimarina]
MTALCNFTYLQVNRAHSLHIKQKGYTIVELMVVLVVSLFLVGGILSVFVATKALTKETISASNRQENAAFALQALSQDLKQSYFFAEASGENNGLWLTPPAFPAITDDCVDKESNGSFPASGNYRALWADTVSGATPTMTCIKDTDTETELVDNSDYISIKRARGLDQTAPHQDDRYYLSITPLGIQAYLGKDVTTNKHLWEYIHHVYYLDRVGDMPRLRRINLQKGKMVADEIIAEGIENMKFMFALDKLSVALRDGAAHDFVNSTAVTSDDWDSGRVVGIKIFLLVRSKEKIAGRKDNETYQLGSFSHPAGGDAYKREVVSRVLMFSNNMSSN